MHSLYLLLRGQSWRLTRTRTTSSHSTSSQKSFNEQMLNKKCLSGSSAKCHTIWKENTAKKQANSPTPLFCEFGPLHCWNILYPNLKAFMGFLPFNINFDCISRGKSLAYEVFQTQVGEYSFCFAVLILALLLVKLSFNFYAFFQYFYAVPKMPRRRILN